MEKIIEVKKCKNCDRKITKIEGDEILIKDCPLKNSLIGKNGLIECIIYEEV